MRQHLVGLAARGFAGLRRLRRGGIGLREDFVDVIDKAGKGDGFLVARMGERDFEVGADAAGIAAEDDDAVGEQDRFFNVVGDDEDSLRGDGLFLPELEEFGAEVFGGEDVQRGEGLVHEEDFGFDDESTGEANALTHAAGEFLGVGALEAVEADGIEHLEAALAAFGGGHAAGFEDGFDIVEHREPGEEGKALKDDGDVDLG